MSVHLQRQIDKLKTLIQKLARKVEAALEQALRAEATRDWELAEQIMAGDNAIDSLEVDIEEECLHTLALHQPVAFDLRYVISVLKINGDLERIADQVVNIADMTRRLADESPLETIPFDLPGMAVQVQRMLHEAIESLVHTDADRAATVCRSDEQVDRIHRRMYDRVEAAIQANPAHTAQLIQMMNISRQLERIADLSVNIAEDVLYMVRGDIARHQRGRSHGQKTGQGQAS